ncbi:MAG: thiamine pyrophosphate-binding protein [Actinobacteria bacterium]|nr:thiamine pyrophosphate-binding protein [Actinomycetota bacterium]
MKADLERKVSGGEVVVDALRALGIDVMFGVPGGQTLAIVDAVLDTEEIRFVTARHEGSAACMADAYARITGRPAACIATTGPGATNMLTGIGGAFRDSSPVIAITCNNRLADLGRDDAQAADHVAIYQPLVKWAKLVSTAGSIRQVLEEAYIRATGGCPGPVLVDFARDVLEDPVDFDFEPRPGPASMATLARQRIAGDPARIDAAAEVLAGARAPVLWVGNGVKIADAGAAALALGRRFSMPVITTFNGMGAVPTTDPLVYGALTRMGTDLSSRVLADADVLVAVGNSLNAVSTGRWSMALPETIIQVDVEPANVGRYYAERTAGIIGDAAAVMTALAEASATGGRDEAAAAARAERLADLAAARERWWADTDVIAAAPGTISPAAVMREARAGAPEETIALVDAGNPGIWSYLWPILRSGTYFKPVGFGNMGFALPAAIAAKIARPAAPVLALIGDGSLGMTLAELETVAREELAVCLLVMNDSGYGNIRQEQLLHYGERRLGVDFVDVDYAAIARACGLQAVRVTEAGELADVVADAFASGRPWLIDAVIDPDISAWTYPPFRPYRTGDE